MWILSDAIEYVRLCEIKLQRIGYHAAIGGSVVMKGSSDKDLDVFVYPHKTTDTIPIEDIQLNLPSSQFKLRPHGDYGDGKSVYSSMTDDGKKVDFFFVQ